jgi:tRNA(adenine34) deaminase
MAERHQVHAMYFKDRHLDTMDFIRDAFREDLKIDGGVLGNKCAGLYYLPNDTPPIAGQTNI